MKMNIATVALAVISAAILINLVAGGGFLPYVAEENVATPDHADASTISIMITEDAEIILPLMESIISLSSDAMFQMYLSDPESAARYLASYDKAVSRLNTNIAKLKLSATEINTFKKESAALGASIQIVLDDTNRLNEITQLNKQYTAAGNTDALYQLAAESALISSELALVQQDYIKSADALEDVTKSYGLDPAKLTQSVEHLTQIINMAGSSESSDSTDTSGSITLSVTPITARYGDTLTVSGVSRNTQPTLSIYWDTNLWATSSADTANHYAQKFTIGQISKGIHAVTVQSDGISSKPVYITILSRPSVVTIIKAEQSGDELHRRLTLYGLLR
ncbi:MAG TPA: hypothetical protein O0X01_00615, partial [Methanocorpusculum sp.]|nr:hypothetical protein [Methanocorpusculum sp.]